MDRYDREKDRRKYGTLERKRETERYREEREVERGGQREQER